MWKQAALLGFSFALILGCSSFDDNYEDRWGDDDCASGDDDVVGDDDDHVGDDDDHVGDDDDASGSPVIRVDPTTIRMKVEVLAAKPATADLTLFNDGDVPLVILSVTQTAFTNGIDVSAFGGEIGIGAHHTISPVVVVECHAEGELLDVIEVASNDMANNPLEVPIIVQCLPAA